MFQVLPYDKIEMRHGLPDFYVKEIEHFLNTLDDSVIEYFVEVDLKYPDEIEEKKLSYLSWEYN